MALIDSLRNNTIAQPKPIEKLAEKPIQAQQLDKPVQAQIDKLIPAQPLDQPVQAQQADRAAELQQAQRPEPFGQAEPIAQAQLQTDAFEAPVRGRPNITGTTAREQAMSNAETAALGRLNEAQRDQYLNTRDALANDPSAQSSLRSLLFNGKLTKSEASHGKGNLLDQLDRLSAPDATTIDGVDKNKLLSQVVKDVSRPFTIDQGRGNFFCGATASLTGLAYRNPAEYARIAVDLGTQGTSTLAGHYKRDAADGSFQKGDQIVLDVKPENLGDNRRSVTQQLMAPALTEVGNGEHYDVREDGTNVHRGFGRHHGPHQVQGTYSDQVATMQESLTGEDTKGVRLDRDEPAETNEVREAAKELIREQIEAGATVAIKKDHDGAEEHGEHWYTVTDLVGDQATVSDNEGGTKTMSLDELLADADAITYEEDKATPPPTLVNDQNVTEPEDPGGGLRNGGGTIDPGD